jgi:hypothetical protein
VLFKPSQLQKQYYTGLKSDLALHVRTVEETLLALECLISSTTWKQWNPQHAVTGTASTGFIMKVSAATWPRIICIVLKGFTVTSCRQVQETPVAELSFQKKVGTVPSAKKTIRVALLVKTFV